MGAGAVSRTIGISSRKISHASWADWGLRAGWGSEEARLPYLDREAGGVFAHWKFYLTATTLMTSWDLIKKGPILRSPRPRVVFVRKLPVAPALPAEC